MISKNSNTNAIGEINLKNHQETKRNTEDTKLQNDCFEYMETFSRTVFENEMRREDSLIQQASQMQTAFSFVIAAVFMVAPIVIENRGNLSLCFMLIVFSTITLSLVFSLFSATMAQNRLKRDDFPTVSTIKTKIISEYQHFSTPAQRSKYLVDTYEIMHESYITTNEKRRKWVIISMRSFYASLFLCVFWFIVAICKII